MAWLLVALEFAVFLMASKTAIWWISFGWPSRQWHQPRLWTNERFLVRKTEKNIVKMVVDLIFLCVNKNNWVKKLFIIFENETFH